MHPYSTDESRVRVYSWLAVLAVVVAWGVVALASTFKWPEWLVSPPSLAGTYALLYAFFDRYLWRLPIVRRMGIVAVANIAGEYEGSLVSTFKDSAGVAARREVLFRISQTWTRICIEMTVVSGTSSSESISALGAIRQEGSATRLTYIYRNAVNPGIAETDMGDHEGAADLRILGDGALTGRYFNSRPRAGTIMAQRRS